MNDQTNQSDERPSNYQKYIDENVAKAIDAIFNYPWRMPKANWKASLAREATAKFGVERMVVINDIEKAGSIRIGVNKNKPKKRPIRWWIGIYIKIKFITQIILPILRFVYIRFGSKERLTRLSRGHVREKTQQEPIASIVVLCYNRRPYMLTTLESLFRTTKREDFELIVVDNGSTDGTAEDLAKLAEQGTIDKLILRNKNHGTSPGFNVGFAYSNPKSKYLIKLDSDIIILTRNWLPKMVSFFNKNSETAILCLNQINNYTLLKAPSLIVGDEKVISWVYWVIGGSCMTIPRTVFDKMGYFYEGFRTVYMPDDLDYFLRCSASDYESYYLEKATTLHRHDLDESNYEAEKVKQRHELLSTVNKLSSAYLLENVNFKVMYPYYENCTFPEGQRIIRID